MPLATLQIQAAAYRFLVDKRNDDVYSARLISNIFFFVLSISVPIIIISSFAFRF